MLTADFLGRAGDGRGREAATSRRRELPLPRDPRLADLDIGDRIRAHLVGIAFQDREIRFLAVFERAEAVALSELVAASIVTARIASSSVMA